MSASVTQLPSSCTRAAGVAAAAAGWDRCTRAGLSGLDPLAAGAFGGRGGRRPFSLLRAGLAMATDILRQVLSFGDPLHIRGLDGRSQGKGGAARSASSMRDEQAPGPLNAGFRASLGPAESPD